MPNSSSTPTHDELAGIDDLADELGRPRRRVVRRSFHTSAGRISGLQWGDAPSRAVLLHGGGQNAHTWDAMLLFARRAGLALDLPGHGHSSWFDDATYLPRRMAPPIAEVIRNTAGFVELLVGMSLGAMTALQLAAQYPELVKNLVLVDASPGVQPEQAVDITTFVEQREYSDFESLLSAAQAYRPGRSRTALSRSLLNNARETEHGTWTWRADRRGDSDQRLRRIFDDLPTYWKCVETLQCPTVLVLGEQSRIVSETDVQEYRARLPGIRIVEVPAAGHNVQGDQPVALEVVLSTLVSTSASNPT